MLRRVALEVMSLVSRLWPSRPGRLSYTSTAEHVTLGLDLSGRHFLVTGASSGLGRETVRVLALRGATVWAAARTAERAADALVGLSGDLRPLACDLENLSQVRGVVDGLLRSSQELDGIIANAGVMAIPTLELVRGYEKQFMVNHVGHFALIVGLLEKLSPSGRVVVVSSEAHRAAPRGGIDFDNLDGSQGYQAWQAYGRSKLANLLFARELAKRLRPGQTANAVHPGVIQTNLGRHMSGPINWGWKLGALLFFKSIEQGAATQCYVATHPDVAVSGCYFSNCRQRSPSRWGADEGLAKRLFDKTEQLIEELESDLNQLPVTR